MGKFGMHGLTWRMRLQTTQQTQAAVQIVSNLPAPSNGSLIYRFLACGPAGRLALLRTKAGDVETNPGPTTLNKKVWICDICHKQIHVRKQISIRCNRIEHWVHLRCACIRQAQYTDTWTCHLHPHRPEPNTYTCHTLHQHLSQARHLY